MFFCTDERCFRPLPADGVPCPLATAACPFVAGARCARSTPSRPGSHGANELEHRVQKTFGLSPREPEHKTKHQRRLDGDIGVIPLASRFQRRQRRDGPGLVARMHVPWSDAPTPFSLMRSANIIRAPTGASSPALTHAAGSRGVKRALEAMADRAVLSDGSERLSRPTPGRRR